MTTRAAIAADATILEQVHDLIGVGIWGWDAESDTVYWNDESFRILGLGPQSMAPDTGAFLSFVVPADRGRVAAIIQQALRGHEPYEFDCRIERRSGEVRHIDGRGFVMCDELGRVVRLVGTVMDVTARAREQEALRQSEERFRSVFEQSAVGIAVTDVTLRIVRTNQSFANMVGRAPEDLIGLSVLDLTHPDDVEAMRSLYRDHVERGTASLTYEKRYRRPDGRTVWARASVTQLKDDAGRLSGYLGVVEDITERKQAAEALERQTELLQKVMDNLPVMIAMYGPDARPILLNREWERKFGWSLAETENVDLVGAVLPDHSLRAQLAALARTATPTWTDLEPRARDGRVVPSAWACIGLSDGTRLTIGKDNTEQRAMEQRLVQSQRMEALGQLAGGVAHDFNNILTVITACATFIRDAQIERSDVLEDVKQIAEACKRAEALTRQLLAFSRRQMLKPEVVDVNLGLRNLAKTLHRLLGEQIELAMVPSAPLSTIHVDAYQLEQVILNLSVNARDAVKERGTIRIATTNVSRHEREYLVISVEDDGEGIPEHVRDRIFEPFFTTKAIGKGTGLGLATVLGIVEQSGGFLEVDSTVGVGTTFRVFLPTVDADPLRPGAHDAVEDLRGTETVLLVEDEAVVRGMVRRLLGDLGYTVLEARHGADALSVSREHEGPIHLLVTDVVMPEMGGRELARAIRLERPGLPILYVSGYTDDELLRRGILEGGAKLLRKPFLPLELARAVHELVTPPAVATARTTRS